METRSSNSDFKVFGELEGLRVIMYTTHERRAKPRIECNFPAIVEGNDNQGNKYKGQATLANLSAGGLYMWVDRYIEPGSKLDITILPCTSNSDEDSTKLITHGIVVRTEPHTEEVCGVAIKFYSYRFA